MSKNILLASGFFALASVAAGGYWMLRTPEPAWTTDSPQALAEFEQGFADVSRF